MFPSLEEFEKLLSQLENLDLSNDSAEKEIYDIFRNLETFPIVAYSLPANYPVTRARLNIDGIRFNNVSEVWHKPDKYNTDYGRASNPHFNILYAAFNPYPSDSVNYPCERITAMCEVSEFALKETEDLKTETVTFARFTLGKELKLVCPFDFSLLSSESPILSEMNRAFVDVVRQSPDYSEQIIRFNNFIASQFSKYPIKDTFEYKISALFTEFMFGFGFDGIIYPSVKTDQKGFNLAVNSKVVEENFKLFAVAECTHYHKGKYSITNNELMTDIIHEDGSFELSSDHNYKRPEKEIMAMINRYS